MDDCIKAVEFASRRLGISPAAFIRILNADAITSLVECAMRVEDTTIQCPDGRVLPDLTFRKAITMLGAMLDTLADIGVNTSANSSLHRDNDNNMVAQPATGAPLLSYTSNPLMNTRAGMAIPVE